MIPNVSHLSVLITLFFSLITSFAGNAAIEKSAQDQARESLKQDVPEVALPDLERHLLRMTSEEYEGRATGTPGELRATAYAAECLAAAGLKPEGDEGTWYEAFPFIAGYTFSGDNLARVDWGAGVMQDLEVRQSFSPLTFSPNGKVPMSSIVFVGFGAQKEGYDSYEGLDVKDKWVITFRGSTKEGDVKINEYRSLISKATLAKDLGACGVIFVKGNSDQVPGELTLLQSVGERGRILPAISIKNDIAASLLGVDNEGFDALYDAYTTSKKVVGYPLDTQLGVTVGVESDNTKGRNVLGRLQVGETPSKEIIVIGAHIDHLGFGQQGGSRARGRDRNKLHPGADDNATGTAAVLEIAQQLAAEQKAGKTELKRDIVFALFSGEEMGLHGSRYYVNQRTGDKEGNGPKIAAYLNMDMIGRPVENILNVNGIGSSSLWPKLVEIAAKNCTLEPRLKTSPHVPSDASSFYGAGIPIISLHTAIHGDYHTPADDAEKIDMEGLTQATHYVRDLTRACSSAEEEFDYIDVPRFTPPRVIFGFRSGETAGSKGVEVMIVSADMPADKAGLKSGDIIIEVDGKKITTIESLTTLQNNMRPGKAIPLVVMRSGERLELEITPAKRNRR